LHFGTIAQYRDLTQAFRKAAVVALPRWEFYCVRTGGAIEP
jgi:hypothetical protein